MRLALTIIGIALAVWLIAAIVVCDGTIPFCVGASVKALFTGIVQGLMQ